MSEISGIQIVISFALLILLRSLVIHVLSKPSCTIKKCEVCKKCQVCNPPPCDEKQQPIIMSEAKSIDPTPKIYKPIDLPKETIVSPEWRKSRLCRPNIDVKPRGSATYKHSCTGNVPYQQFAVPLKYI